MIYKLLIRCFLLTLPLPLTACPKIYIIRHAEVQFERPGWGSSLDAYVFKAEYNASPILNFDPGSTLSKIENYELVDTVFCSPQPRALQTAHLLFDETVDLRINSNLMELQYQVLEWPLVQMPVRAWLAASMMFWMAGANDDRVPSYRERKSTLNIFSEELITYAEQNGSGIVVAHAVVNRELIRILKKRGWKLEHREGYENLSVNCLVKKDCANLPSRPE